VIVNELDLEMEQRMNLSGGLEATPVVVPSKSRMFNCSSLQDSGFESRHESGFLISPPTRVTFCEETPRPYFLRGQPKYSSTPHLQGPGGSQKALPEDLGLVSNLKERLEFIVETGDRAEAEDDSGIETLSSSPSEVPSSSPDSRLVPGSPEQPSSSAETSRLGAVPVRRSPRHLAKSGDGLDRMTRLKAQGKPEAVLNTKSEDRIRAFKNFSHSTTKFPPSQKRVLFKYDPRPFNDGEETFDILRHLFEMDLGHIRDNIFKYCSAGVLCQVSQVSQMWKLSLMTSRSHDERRLKWVEERKLNQENFGYLVLGGSTRSLLSPRRPCQTLNTNRSPGQGKRDRGASAAKIVSPSKIRHRLFLEEVSKLSPGERLTQCPVCTSPSRVAGPIATCSKQTCNFTFCPDCLCEQHGGRGCRVTRTGSKVPKSGAVTSKKSKERLRRL